MGRRLLASGLLASNSACSESQNATFARYAALLCSITCEKAHERCGAKGVWEGGYALSWRWTVNVLGVLYVLCLFRKSHNVAVELAFSQQQPTMTFLD